jgi:hypothetical protein
MISNLHKGSFDRFEESDVVIRSILCDFFHMGNFHPLLDSVAGGKQGLFHFGCKYGDCGWDDCPVVFELFLISEVESDDFVGSFIKMACIDFRGCITTVPAYEFVWDDFGVYGVIQPRVPDVASDG